MKTTTSASPSRPRLACQWVRQWSAANSAHVATCTDCQRYFAAASSLESALRHDAQQLAAPTPADNDMSRRIVEAVHRSKIERSEATRSLRPSSGLWLGSGVFAAAAALAIALMVSPRGHRDTDHKGSATSSSDQEVAAALASDVQSMSNRLVDTVIPTAGAIVADNPMQRELGSLRDDARSVVGFLAMNFLPSSELTVAPQHGASSLN